MLCTHTHTHIYEMFIFSVNDVTNFHKPKIRRARMRGWLKWNQPWKLHFVHQMYRDERPNMYINKIIIRFYILLYVRGLSAAVPLHSRHFARIIIIISFYWYWCGTNNNTDVETALCLMYVYSRIGDKKK